MSAPFMGWKPGAIVRGPSLAREAMLIGLSAENTVEVLTENGKAVVPGEGLVLVAESLRNLTADLEQSGRQKLEDFKREVAVRASDAKAEHGWCEEVDAVLEDLGLKTMTRSVAGTLVIRLDFRARVPWDSKVLEKIDKFDADWWRRTVSVETSYSNDREIRVGCDSDLDEDSIEVVYASHDLEDLTMEMIEGDD